MWVGLTARLVLVGHRWVQVCLFCRFLLSRWLRKGLFGWRGWMAVMHDDGSGMRVRGSGWWKRMMVKMERVGSVG